jgi:Tol biopolymer transport system component
MRFSSVRRPWRVAFLAIALAALTASPAAARPPGTNGQIAFARFNPLLGDTQVYVINPDGMHERLVQAPTDFGECPQWFPDGAHIAICGSPALPGGGSRIINPDDGTFRDIDGQDPTLFNPCGWPSPNGSRLLCETFSDDGSQNGVHTIRASDGGGFDQITSNPGGDDAPWSWSPDGRRIVFERFGPDSYEGVFVVNVNGTGLKRILPPTIQVNCCVLDWSPQGNEIAFSRHVTPDVHSSLWTVHSDGSDLRPVNVQPASACGGSNDDPAAEGCLEPDWSPDGTQIAFARGHDLDVDGQVDIVSAHGGPFTQVTQTPASQNPDWGTHPLAGS